jgi:hypothetical protein
LSAALQHGDADVEPSEELREFHRDGAAAEYDERLGRTLELDGVVTSKVAGLRERGQGRRCNDGASGEDEVPGAQRATVVELHRVRVEKTRRRADELEPAVGELLSPETCEVGDHRVLAFDDPSPVELHRAGAQSPCCPMSRKVADLGGVEQGLGGHATAQDAQPAEFLRAVDDNSLQTPCRRRARGGVAARAATDHRDIVVEPAIRFAHDHSMVTRRRNAKRQLPFAKPSSRGIIRS